MTAIATSAGGPQVAGQPGKTTGRRTANSLWSCLLVSTEDRLLRRMSEAAQSVGWNPVECRTIEESIRLAVLQNFPLALLDLSGVARGNAFEDLVRQLRQSASNLVVICDRDANPDGELWSRQNGAWMYLPNVDEKSDLARICREAKAIAEKLRGQTFAKAVG